MEDDSYTELQYHTDTQPDDKQPEESPKAGGNMNYSI